MNVLQLCTKVPVPAKDGGSLAILSFAQLLQSDGHQVTIFAANTPKHFQADFPENYNGIILKAVRVNTEINWINVFLNFLFSHKPYLLVRFKNHNFKLELKKLLQHKVFDVIQLEGPYMGLYLPVIRKHSNSKVVLRAHNVEHLLWSGIKNEARCVFRRIYLEKMVNRLRKFEIELISQIDGVITITENDLHHIKKIANPKSCEVVTFGIDIANYKVEKNPQRNSIFYIGALDWLPNQDGLCWFLDNVWVKLQKQLPYLTFHVAGRNAPVWLQNRLKAGNVYFYGEVSNARDFMGKFLIQVVPLFSGSGVRIKILEGMALGKPIVTTSKGVEGIDITDGNELLIADSPELFIIKIKEIISDPSKQNSIGHQARAFISKEFDNLALSNKIERFYQKLALV